MSRYSVALPVLTLVAGCLAERGPLTNRMEQAGTAYLERAADQPIGWQPWGRQAFALAARLNRPVLLYIGAADCRSCERMDRESYGDPALGALIDSLFVPVRVDRDERPDLARRYQVAVHALAGLRGYPLTLFLTPDGAAFFGGTYFPNDDPVTGRGLRQILPEVARSYRDRRETIVRRAALVRQLAVTRSVMSHGVLRPELVEHEVAAVRGEVEAALGAPARLATFPHAQAVSLLLDEYGRDADTVALRLARAALHLVDSLDAIGAVAESSPDLVRAMLLRNFTAAWALTADTQFLDAGRELVRALTRRLERNPRFSDREAYVIGALIDAAPALGDMWAGLAARARLERLLERTYVPGDGVRHAGAIHGLLQDQVQVAAACLAAYQAFDEPLYLEVARDLTTVLDRYFADPMGGYFDAEDADPAAPALADRTKQVLDDLLPGANAWAARVFLRLADFTGDARYRARGEATLAAFVGEVRGQGVRAASYLTVARDVLARR
jgi:uncharacterized protein YyaL (SSP411 family)